MAKLVGVKEVIHKPFYDHIIRSFGAPAQPTPQTLALFGNRNIGLTQFTNAQAAGALPSDQSLVILSIRAFAYFDNAALYSQLMNEVYITIRIGDKDQFGPIMSWYYPSGGGLAGFDAAGAQHSLSLGTPEHPAALRVAKPLAVPPRQQFTANVQFFAVDIEATTTGYVSLLDAVNTSTAGVAGDTRVMSVIVDGLLSRDVQ